jgi:hypothetical protein
MSLTSYVLDRSLCARCGNEGTLKHEGKLEGCPDCPRGQEVNRQLAEIHAEQAADVEPFEPYTFCVQHGVDLTEDETCDYCIADRTDSGAASDEPHGFCFLHGEEWDKGGCEGCADEHRDTRRAAFAEKRAAS